MIAPFLVAQIRRLLAEEKLSQRKIALLVGVARNTVDAIASGKHHNPDAVGPDDDGEPRELPQRCPQCGGLVYPPCRLCRMRRLSRFRRLPAQSDACNDAPIDLQLKQEHQRRYEEVRANRRGAT